MKPILEKVERIEAWEHGYHDGIFVVSTQTEGLHRPPHTILEIIQEIFAGKVYLTQHKNHSIPMLGGHDFYLSESTPEAEKAKTLLNMCLKTFSQNEYYNKGFITAILPKVKDDVGHHEHRIHSNVSIWVDGNEKLFYQPQLKSGEKLSAKNEWVNNPKIPRLFKSLSKASRIAVRKERQLKRTAGKMKSRDFLEVS